MKRHLGRKPAVADARVPFVRDVVSASTLAKPPSWVNRYAGVDPWGMLANDKAGTCVVAMAGHVLRQAAQYRNIDLQPTDAEALALYSELTGYDPDKPETDQGTVVMGPTGLMQRWATSGIVFGGKLSVCTAFAQVAVTGGLEPLCQAIHLFGGVALGIDMPASLLVGDDVPFMWDDATGPSADGHEVYLVGYDTTVAGDLYFSLVSWGTIYRMTAGFLDATVREAVAIYDRDSLDMRGLSPDDFDEATLLAGMAALRA